ncbi:MAG: hypothetical protein LBI13_03885 [Streptococcaceae bacterium]|jgi:peptidoglycan/LPS O-acetylase OafA/YrhL|nr:hypothetical protein [Streptococcaceae bacterium]
MKLDKIIFTDNKVDFYIDGEGKVFARTHTAFASDNGNRNFLMNFLFISPLVGFETLMFKKFSILFILLIIFIAFILGIVCSYFIEKYTLKKQIFNKNFIQIRDELNLRKGFEIIRFRSHACSTIFYFAIIGAISFLGIALNAQDQQTKSTFLFVSALCIFIISFLLYRFIKLKQAYKIYKKIQGID